MLLFTLFLNAFANEWQSAPEPIHTLLQAKRPPSVQLSANKRWILELERPNLPPITDLQAPVERLGGRKINPQTNGPARPSYYTGLNRMTIEDPMDKRTFTQGKMTYVTQSPSGEQAFFAELKDDGYRLWLLDMTSLSAQSLGEQRLNATYGNPCRWRTETSILCKVIPSDRTSPPLQTVPTPRIEENNGASKPVRTYTNLLQSQLDMEKFEYYFESELWSFSTDGTQEQILDRALFQSFSPSPNGKYVLVSELQKPWSTMVPLSRFAKQTYVVDAKGQRAHTVATLPIADDINTAFNSVRTGKRTVSWRSDEGATLWWVEALDDGDARKEADKRDALYTLSAPFSAQPTLLFSSELRFYDVVWGNKTTALVYTYWYDSRTLREWKINPKRPSSPQKIVERDYQDAYSDPGSILQKRTKNGSYVIQFSKNGKSMYRSGRGASPDGVFPFLDKCPTNGGACQRIWQANGENYESFFAMLDDNATTLITQYQDVQTPRNLRMYDTPTSTPRALTNYVDHMPDLAGLQKELLQYQRKDGLSLSATLYLPPGYTDTDGPLPTLLWAYPSEFKSASSAGQIRNSPYTFSRPSYSSVLFLLTQGYAVVLNPTMPIIGEGSQEPNDAYVEQLVMGAEAIVQHLVDLGVSNPQQMAIGGHSYGAFTTANLLAHTDLFQAGIARSGAYNRTLTPFGFQSEQRTFWENPNIYYTMSPFMQAHNINEPLLLLHGADDPNAGTYPMQSKRMFEALKGLGATVRWVELPYEEHGYRSKEAIEHVHWEMTMWLNTHLSVK